MVDCNTIGQLSYLGEVSVLGLVNETTTFLATEMTWVTRQLRDKFNTRTYGKKAEILFTRWRVNTREVQL